MFLIWVKKAEIQLAKAHSKLSVFEALSVKKNETEREIISKLVQQASKKSNVDPLVRERERLLEAKRRQAAVAKCEFEEAATYCRL